MELTAENVHAIVMDCLYNEGEPIEDHVEGTAIRRRLGFHPGRLKASEGDIADMIDQLPDGFKQGDSFLNACIRKDGVQWGEHDNIDELLCLGTATGKLGFPFPREVWRDLPGGMPYIIINKFT